MVRFGFEVEIDRPVSEVFAYVTDLDRLPEWQPNVISATMETDGPLGTGSRIREVRRGPFGRRFESLVEVAEYEPDRRFDLHIVEGPLPVDGALEFEDLSGRTRILFVAEGSPSGPMRVLEPLLAVVLKRQFVADYGRLKERLESG